MIPLELRGELERKIAGAEYPREMAIDVLAALQNHYGYLSDEAVEEASGLLGMTPLELDELATFYDFLYREPAGKYIIHVCDGIVCWMNGYPSLRDHLCARLGIQVGETTPDGLVTLEAVTCLAGCHRGPLFQVQSGEGITYHENQTVESAMQLVDSLRQEEAEP